MASSLKLEGEEVIQEVGTSALVKEAASRANVTCPLSVYSTK